MVESILDDLLHYQYIELLAIYEDSTNVPEEEQYARNEYEASVTGHADQSEKRGSHEDCPKEPSDPTTLNGESGVRVFEPESTRY